MQPKAAVVSIDWESGDCLFTLITGADPIESARSLRESIKDDFPGYDHHIVANESARQRHAQAILDVPRLKGQFLVGQALGLVERPEPTGG